LRISVRTGTLGADRDRIASPRDIQLGEFGASA